MASRSFLRSHGWINKIHFRARDCCLLPRQTTLSLSQLRITSLNSRTLCSTAPIQSKVFTELRSRPHTKEKSNLLSVKHSQQQCFRASSGNTVEDEEKVSRKLQISSLEQKDDALLYADLDSEPVVPMDNRISYKFNMMAHISLGLRKSRASGPNIPFLIKHLPNHSPLQNADVDDVEDLAELDMLSASALQNHPQKKTDKLVSVSDAELLKQARTDEKYWLHMYSNIDPSDNTVYPEAFKEHDEMADTSSLETEYMDSSINADTDK